MSGHHSTLQQTTGWGNHQQVDFTVELCDKVKRKEGKDVKENNCVLIWSFQAYFP
jgi:hypothetical protein